MSSEENLDQFSFRVNNQWNSPIDITNYSIQISMIFFIWEEWIYTLIGYQYKFLHSIKQTQNIQIRKRQFYWTISIEIWKDQVDLTREFDLEIFFRCRNDIRLRDLLSSVDQRNDFSSNRYITIKNKSSGGSSLSRTTIK